MSNAGDVGVEQPVRSKDVHAGRGDGRVDRDSPFVIYKGHSSRLNSRRVVVRKEGTEAWRWSTCKFPPLYRKRRAGLRL